MSADSLGLLLKAFRLPTMAEMYERVVKEAEQQGWGYRKFLLHLCEAEAQDRAERKLERLLKQSGLPGGKNLGSLEEAKLPVKVRRVLPSLLDGGFVARAENVIALGLPGRGKSHFLAALGRGTDPAAQVCRALHPDLQAGPTAIGRQTRSAAGGVAAQARPL
jgi:DNA replication protein DnaC